MDKVNLKEIIIETTTEGADFVSGIFFSLGASGVKILDPNDIDEVLSDSKSWDYVEENLLENRGGPVQVSCFVSENDLERKIEEIKAELNQIRGVDMGSLTISVRDYADHDWLTEWKKYYKPIRAGGFIVVPEWENYQQKSNEIIIKIDPTMAFGTGEHESTRLCLTLLSGLEVKGKQVIDVGTGSGILGIGAAKMGAAHCYMCDIDSLSIQSATQNAVLNKVFNRVTIEESDLISQTGLVADIVLANLTADILIRLAESLPKHIKQGGSIVCSGIIQKRKTEVIRSFQKYGLKLLHSLDMGEWNALLFTR
ncbi:MAG: 50S ribosomal protein L11 methyltransferase [Clostridia bacterium]|nr:50S ribosomal protein L11 methyltransferase [Clostridia bacterium]